MAQYKVALDAGHGGSDPGAVYNGRQEKDDVLDLTLAVGDILKKAGVDVYYTRTTDEYETPFKKATDANNSNADLFVSIHRNSSETPNQYSGVQTLVYNDSGLKAEVARNINNQLEDVGFKNLGVDERRNLVVLKRTKMPAVLVEAGFINNDKDNYMFDNDFDKIAQAIADGILESIPASSRTRTTSAPVDNSSYQEDTPVDNSFDNEDVPVSSLNTTSNIPEYNPNIANSNIDNSVIKNNLPNELNYVDTSSENVMPTNSTPAANSFNNFNNYRECNCNNCSDANMPLYRVQTGAFRNKENADRMLNSLLIDGFPAFIIYEDGYYKVQVGAYRILANAIKMEQRLRRFHYSTYIVYS